MGYASGKPGHKTSILLGMTACLCLSIAIRINAGETTAPQHEGDWIPIYLAPEEPITTVGGTRSQAQTAWRNPIVKKGKLNNPLVEVTPFLLHGQLYLLENWQKHWDLDKSKDGAHFEKDEVRIRRMDDSHLGDLERGEVVSVPLIGHGLGMALAWQDEVYVFAGNWGKKKKWRINEITMIHSPDLKTWSDPVTILRANDNEHFFNVSVCRADDRFVLLVESNDPTWPAFTFKYFESDNLTDWQQIPDAVYGKEKYVGGPALYYYGDTFYTLYLQSLGRGCYETRVTRSRDLIHWHDAPTERTFITFNSKNKVHALRPPEIREKNASDVELCAYQGKTVIYYTGGDQHIAGEEI